VDEFFVFWYNFRVKILLLGGTGMLGTEFRKIFDREKITFLAPDRSTLDLENTNSIANFFEKNLPESFEKIVDCAGWTAVDRAESEREKCEAVNVSSLKNLVAYKIPIVHFSTDYVFDAPENFEIPENFERAPLNFYGETKSRAEHILENSEIRWWNVRTSWLIGEFGENFVEKILEKSRENLELRIVADEIGRPTFAADLAEHVVKFLVKNSPASGHFHFQNSGPAVSWVEFAEKFLEISGRKNSVKKITAAEISRAAKRPKNSRLKNSKTPPPPDWRESLEKFLKNLSA
jgi:dTDP-4-dehydrorhamnose reductase